MTSRILNIFNIKTDRLLRSLATDKLSCDIHPRKMIKMVALPTESVFGVRMLNMLTDSAMSASGVQIEATTFVRVKILEYHDMLPFLLPIHLYKHKNMIYLWNSSCTFLNCITTYCLRRIWLCMDSLWRLTFDGCVWIPYGGWHFEPNHTLWFWRHI